MSILVRLSAALALIFAAGQACELPGQGLPPRQLLSDPPPPISNVTLDAAAATGRALAGSDSLLAVRFDRPRVDGPLLAMGRTWKAGFDASGCTFIPFFGANAPRNYPMRFHLVSATADGEPIRLTPSPPTREGNVVSFDRGGAVEVFDTSLEGVEQSVVFSSLPRRGKLSVAIQIAGDLDCTTVAAGLRFANEHGHVDYTKALAFDAAGRSIPIDITWSGGHARMELPAEFVAQATLPIVIDPWITGQWNVGAGTTQAQSGSDVATIQAEGKRTIVVWLRRWSLVDRDCFATVLQGQFNENVVSSLVTVDIGTEDWHHVSVAGNNFAKNFMVVGEVSGPWPGPHHYIAGRIVRFDGVTGAAFDIARETLSPSYQGNNFHPGVGSDPYPGEGYYCVVWCHEFLLESRIHYRVVTTSGGILSPMPGILDASYPWNFPASRPTIGKSCGSFNGLGSHWIVAWEDVVRSQIGAALIDWDGNALHDRAGGVMFTYGDSAPAASSPIDVGGTRYWMVACKNSSGVTSDIRCLVYRDIGIAHPDYRVIDEFNVSFAEGVSVSNEQSNPAIDSDGLRCSIAYTDLGSSGNRDVRVCTVRYFQGATAGGVLTVSNGVVLVDASHILVGNSAPDQSEVRVCANFSGGNQGSARFVISSTNHSDSVIRADTYDAYVPGPLFTHRSSGCGGSISLVASGTPALGEQVTLSVPNAALSGITGIMIGSSASSMIGAAPCLCLLGVANPTYYAASYTWPVPRDTFLVGMVFSAQGWTYSGSSCLGNVAVSNVIDFALR